MSGELDHNLHFRASLAGNGQNVHKLSNILQLYELAIHQLKANPNDIKALQFKNESELRLRMYLLCQH